MNPEDQVDKGDVVNQVNSELKIEGNSIALTTGHFTISSNNFNVDSSGNVAISGDLTSKGAIKVSNGSMSGSITIGSSGFNQTAYSLQSDLSVLSGTSEIIGRQALYVDTNTEL